MPLQLSLVQSFVLIFKTRSQFGELVQNFELKRIGGAPKGHQFAPLKDIISAFPLLQLHDTGNVICCLPL